VLGEVTQGDYGLRQYIKLAGGDFVYLATHQMTMGDGTRYDGSHGIHPDVSVADVNIKVAPISPELSFNHRESTDDEDRIGERIKERTGDDAVLQRAVDVLLGLKALNIRAIGKAP
jgi:C-terminal processing protease CtpA/Prc